MDWKLISAFLAGFVIGSATHLVRTIRAYRKAKREATLQGFKYGVIEFMSAGATRKR